jgi:hypothetical protein
MAVLDSRQWSPSLLDQTILLHHSFRGRKRSDHRDRCNECCKGRLMFHVSVSLKGSHTLENTVAAIGRHRLGAESDAYSSATRNATPHDAMHRVVWALQTAKAIGPICKKPLGKPGFYQRRGQEPNFSMFSL